MCHFIEHYFPPANETLTPRLTGSSAPGLDSRHPHEQQQHLFCKTFQPRSVAQRGLIDTNQAHAHSLDYCTSVLQKLTSSIANRADSGQLNNSLGMWRSAARLCFLSQQTEYTHRIRIAGCSPNDKHGPSEGIYAMLSKGEYTLLENQVSSQRAVKHIQTD